MVAKNHHKFEDVVSHRITATISWFHQRFPCELSSEERAQKFHTDDLILFSAGQCSWLVGNLLQTITRTIQIWVVTRYLCAISELVLQTPFRGETVRSVAKCRLFLVHLNLAWENRRHSATLPTVFPRNDVWEASAEIPYWWRVSAKIWLVLLIGRAACEICFNQSEALLRSIWVVSRHQYGISTLVS